MSAQQQPWSGLEIETSFFPLSFFLYLCTPTIVIDGVANRRPWGKHNFQLEPGMHNVKIFFHYLFMSTCASLHTIPDCTNISLNFLLICTSHPDPDRQLQKSEIQNLIARTSRLTVMNN